MVPLTGYAPVADHYQFLNVHLSKVSCSIHRVKEYPAYTAKPRLFLVFLRIHSFMAFKVLVRNLLETSSNQNCLL